jgi:hypothetical protein
VREVAAHLSEKAFVFRTDVLGYLQLSTPDPHRWGLTLRVLLLCPPSFYLPILYPSHFFFLRGFFSSSELVFDDVDI